MAVIYFFVFAFGVCVGSFLNVVIYRIPHNMDFVRGRSICPSCKHELVALDIIPVISYLLLGRRCRYCHKQISIRYMLVEFAGGILAVCCWLYFMGSSESELIFGLNSIYIFLSVIHSLVGALLGSITLPLAASLYFAVLCILLTISLIDTDTMQIPDGLNIALAICGVLSALVISDITLLERFIGALICSLPLFLVTFIVPGAFGGGDIKLLAAAGILLGWQSCLVALFIGVIIGGTYGIYLILARMKGRKEHFAFGPALCIGIAIALFFGRTIIEFYVSLSAI
jgi:leader peptidase (prepilin peptidase)/N-methyltransferase